MTKNTLKKALLVYALTKQHYEPHSHVNCMRYIYRNVIVKQYPMCESAYFRLIKIAEKHLGVKIKIKDTI
jgi:hypothetical protein